MNPKVSVLVPVYKVSEYIEKCAESIFNQTFQDIEYVFVNDATPDDSIEKLLAVLERFPNRKDRVLICHHEANQGIAATRNTALSAATGDYIAIVDSDDYIDPDMIEVMYNKAVETDADIVVSDIYMEYEDRSVYLEDYLSINDNEHFRDMIINDRSHSFQCDKLIKRELYLNPECRVPYGLNYYEDRYIMTRLFYFAKKIVKINRAFYHYIHYNSLAITKSKTRMHFENVVSFWNSLEVFLKDHNEYETYQQYLVLAKTQSKVRLMIDTNSASLRKEYAGMFLEEEIHCINTFRKGERIMLWLVRNRLFNTAQLFRTSLFWKNRTKSR